MGLAQPKVHYYSLEEYLEIERKADERNEIIDGEIYSIGGDSGTHSDICSNLIGIIGLQLRGTRNRVRAVATRVKSGALKERFGKGMISYPDLGSFFSYFSSQERIKPRIDCKKLIRGFTF
ncbi:MAG TPA: Uma2 family endonuclease [Pyrinomonadaceae bacterium]|nr:Uma2 family endonuclease [Pyrinomonadaceae bacterium]